MLPGTGRFSSFLPNLHCHFNIYRKINYGLFFSKNRQVIHSRKQVATDGPVIAVIGPQSSQH